MFSLVALLSLSTLFLFSVLPVVYKPVVGIPGLQVSFVQEKVYSSHDSEVIVECFVDTSELELDFKVSVGFTTNSTIDGFCSTNFVGNPSKPVYSKVTLSPTSANIGETIEVSINFACGSYFQVETAYVIIT